MRRVNLATLPGKDGLVAMLDLHSVDEDERGRFGQFRGEFLLKSGFVQANLPTFVGAEDLHEWQAVLDSVDAGQDAFW